jgi:hypothetical protein
MNLRTIHALAIAGSLFGCASAKPEALPKGPLTSTATITVADRAAAKTPSCNEPSELQPRIAKPARHFGMCTE